ncbi:MAG: response regulator [Magnetococcales bacterium]|nr:response regulator [Magnetococcales bacterium]
MHCNTVLVVDDDPIIVTAVDEILTPFYNVRVALDGESALGMVRHEDPPDLILLDMVLPDIDGYEILASLKDDEATRNIPVLFLTGNAGALSEMRAFEMGAVDFIAKPFNSRVVLARVRAHMAMTRHNRVLEHTVQLRTRELKDLQQGIIHRLSRAAEFKDNETGLHVVRMSHYSRLLAHAAGLEGERLDCLFNAAPMHDVGKIGIPDQVLMKLGPLDATEWALMKKHPEIGARILGDHHSELLRMAQVIARTHHEKWDGSGYPDGLVGEQIPVEGRIVAVADVFDALTSARPYKAAWSPARAISFLREESGRHFDPRLVRVFIDIFSDILEVRREFQERSPFLSPDCEDIKGRLQS